MIAYGLSKGISPESFTLLLDEKGQKSRRPVFLPELNRWILPVYEETEDR
jgi:hypothetical protein